MTRPLVIVAAAVLSAAGALTIGAAAVTRAQQTGFVSIPSPGERPRAPFVTQPTPPVTAADFPMEATGAAPVDNDGKIPNPATPTGMPITAPASCTETFASANGATSATVNAWIASHANSIVSPTVLCLSGTFTSPIHVWSKTSKALLEVAPAPGAQATLDLGRVKPADTNSNQYWADSGGVSIVDSRSVEIYGLTVENYTFDGPAHVPAGIYVTARSDTGNTDQDKVPHLSACFLDGGSCSDIYIVDNTVRGVTNTADQNYTTRSVCGNGNVDAYGIAVIAAGSRTSAPLQHVVIENNTVTGTRTGQSETVTFNGDLEDFLAAGNIIDNIDNIGLDTIGWETGTSQANHGYVYNNTIYNVDTWSNAAYGKWNGTRCVAQPENAAGLYDDGGSYIWLENNTVWNTDQGINLDVETGGKETDHLLVADNVVHNDPGTSRSDPSTGTDPPGIQGASTVAGHDPYAMYIDAFGSKAQIEDVYVHDNTFQNESQYYLQPSNGMPVVDIGGIWSNVQVWRNTIEGMPGGTDRYNPLFEVDRQPKATGTETINCDDYEDLSSSGNTINGNFAIPTTDWLGLSAWQTGNKHGWDANSEVDGFSSACPASSIQ